MSNHDLTPHLAFDWMHLYTRGIGSYLHLDISKHIIVLLGFHDPALTGTSPGRSGAMSRPQESRTPAAHGPHCRPLAQR